MARVVQTICILLEIFSLSSARREGNVHRRNTKEQSVEHPVSFGLFDQLSQPLPSVSGDHAASSQF